MRAVGIKVLKNRLSEYVRLAQSGETVMVLDRERVVAELHPPSTRHAPESEDELIARGVLEGWLTPPKHKLTRPPRNFPIMSLEQLLTDLDQARADRDLP